MIRKILTVLLIEDSPEFAELVQVWLPPQDDIEFVLHWTDSLAGGLVRLGRGGVDAILLDLGLPDSSGLETFTTARSHASGVPIIILSGGDQQALALQMVRQGAQDYIVKSMCDSDVLVKALQYAVGRSAQEPSRKAAAEQETVIGVMGAKGGVGTTTLACNLAIELRRQTDQSTLLADMDVNSGLVNFLMNTEAEHSMLDVAAANRRDASFPKNTVTHGPCGVDIIRSLNLRGTDKADLRRIRDGLALIRTCYRWTVLDLGRTTDLSLSLLDKVSELYLVTMLSVPALYEAKRTVGALTRAGLAPDRLRLIVNQFGTTQVSGSELNGLFGVPVYGKLPGAAQELDDACAEGKVLGENSAYRVQVAGLARKAAGLVEKKPAGPVPPLRSFVDMFRKSPRNVAASRHI